jgi:hypothetical protein
MFSAIRLFSTENRDLKQVVNDLGNTKVTDYAKTSQSVKKISRGLWGRYKDAYFVRGGGSFMPIFHAILGIGILGYSWEYNHLSNGSLCWFYNFCRASKGSSRRVPLNTIKLALL